MGDETVENLIRDLHEHLDLANYDAVVASIIENDPDLTRALVNFAIRVLLD